MTDKLKIFIIIWLFLFNSAYAENINILTTIKPIHSIVANITKNILEPNLLINDNNSPHNINLKPSQIKAINDADIIFYIDDNFEIFSKKLFKNLSKETNIYKISSAPNLILLKQRTNQDWQELTEDTHKDHNNDDHHHYHHEKNANDTHIWLSPKNAKIIAIYIYDILVKKLPKKQEILKNNLNKFNSKIDELDINIKKSLNNNNTPFMVFHDAYQYFEKEYNLNNKGVISINTSQLNSAKNLSNINNKIKENNIKIIFKEPQFSAKFTNFIDKDLNIKIKTLDPLGSEITSGPDFYFKLLNDLSSKF